ncbi:MAG: 50S ribosomal protein L17 [Candidatus Moranbacteria bacterium CG23_combo_of_CG06-09_8_20_14_all_35_22]|nr:MAG: 50S ribosomal protein L17 [Candidatus Moranbacteria bacterium CG23_combo_of_CG06-09_8_20_14_all_35_22]
MQHQNKTKEFGRTTDQRKALWKTMLGSLIMEEKIKTTEAKAKELKTKIDKIINKAKKVREESKKLGVRKNLIKYIPEIAIKKISGEFLNKFENRNSGYTRVIKLAPRKSDGARMAIIELI